MLATVEHNTGPRHKFTLWFICFLSPAFLCGFLKTIKYEWLSDLTYKAPSHPLKAILVLREKLQILAPIPFHSLTAGLQAKS